MAGLRPSGNPAEPARRASEKSLDNLASLGAGICAALIPSLQRDEAATVFLRGDPDWWRDPAKVDGIVAWARINAYVTAAG